MAGRTQNVYRNESCEKQKKTFAKTTKPTHPNWFQQSAWFQPVLVMKMNVYALQLSTG